MNKGLPDAIADTSTQHRSLHLSFLLLCVYAAVIVGATKDRQFLLDSEITLPLLGIGLPIQEVYIVLPLMLLILHGNLLLQTLFLSQRIARLPAQEQSECALNVSTFPVIQAMFPATEKNRISVLRWSVVLILLVIIPVSLFLLMQVRALVLQSGALTLWHQLLLSIDIILLWSLWPFRSVTHTDRTKTRILALASTIIILYFTWFDATAVDSKVTHLPQTANLTDLIFRRHLDLITSGSSMQAMTFMLPPQTRHVSMSISNTRFKRCAQLIAAWLATGVASDAATVALLPRPRRAGVTNARY
mgnify:CR=1 FL=1